MKILAEAFNDDPVARWIFPDAIERVQGQPAFYCSLLGHPGAEIYLTTDQSGAAVWLNLPAHRPPHPATPGLGPATEVREASSRLLALGQALSPHHPVDQPHLYLWCMGVVRSHQGAGIGSAMLQHRLDQADAEGLGTYLEASSPQSRALYLRHGFADLTAAVRIADSPPLWPLWRQPN